MNFRFENKKTWNNIIFHAGLWYNVDLEAQEEAWGVSDPAAAREVEKEFKRDLIAYVKANGAEIEYE